MYSFRREKQVLFRASGVLIQAEARNHVETVFLFLMPTDEGLYDGDEVLHNLPAVMWRTISFFLVFRNGFLDDFPFSFLISIIFSIILP